MVREVTGTLISINVVHDTALLNLGTVDEHPDQTIQYWVVTKDLALVKTYECGQNLTLYAHPLALKFTNEGELTLLHAVSKEAKR